MADGNTRVSARRALVALTLLGIAFAYVEAAVVVYLRNIYDPIRTQVYPQHPKDELFPLIKPEHLPSKRLLSIELGRELATLVMLAAAAIAVSRNWREWIAAFGMIFGVWDIFFYVFLKLDIGWPASLFTWDILFLLPEPWVGPVIAPVIVSATMIATGIAVIVREEAGRPVRVLASHWAMIVGGGVIIVASFLWDFRNTMAGNWPNPFAWPIFWTGELLGLAAFVDAWRRPATVHLDP
jgi:hypothetical protein